jgi:hypothetical protein
MIRSLLVATLTLLSVLIGSRSVEAQQTSKPIRIAMVCGMSCDGASSAMPSGRPCANWATSGVGILSVTSAGPAGSPSDCHE